jgi:uncharacterized protein YqeY
VRSTLQNPIHHTIISREGAKQMLNELQNQLKTAMKARDELRTSVLRMLISEFKYAQIDKKGALDEAESLQVVQRAIKKRKEAIEMYEQGGRVDLANKEKSELKILEEFVPAQLDEAAARQKINEVIGELGASGKQDFGRVIKEVLARYKGQIDGKLAQKIIGEILGR